VAVVAPVSEIEEAVRKGHLRQLLLHGLIIVLIILGASAILFFEMRWSRVLGKKVAQRTEDLKKSEEKYRSLVESAEDFIFTVDSEGNFQSMNSFTANFFGGPAEEFLGKGLSNLFPKEIAAKQLRLVRLVYKLGRSVRDEFELKMGENEIWISANFMPLKDEEGGVRAVLCIARDITENKNLERQLINTEKLASLGTLAAGVAHEVNNPLGVILGFCDILIRKTEKGTQEFEDLKAIERQGLHCKQVVENLLSFARLGEGNTEYSDLNQCLEEIIKVVKHTLDMNNIELVLEFGETIPLVKGDSRQLQQVFLNLTNNAIAAMDRGGTLTIRTYFERRIRKAVAQFQDDGIGIRQEDIDHIFEPFFTTKPEGEGTGLGLFVSYGIIAKYGGSIDCVSQATDSPGKPSGTTFTLKFLTKRRGV
jgi:two-component system NtrC family sensor kinase